MRVPCGGGNAEVLIVCREGCVNKAHRGGVTVDLLVEGCELDGSGEGTLAVQQPRAAFGDASRFLPERLGEHGLKPARGCLRTTSVIVAGGSSQDRSSTTSTAAPASSGTPPAPGRGAWSAWPPSG
jgi:hypothetical protein